jgi:hypothetical protein
MFLNQIVANQINNSSIFQGIGGVRQEVTSKE